MQCDREWRRTALSLAREATQEEGSPALNMALKFDVGFSEDENLKWRKSMEVGMCGLIFSRHVLATFCRVAARWNACGILSIALYSKAFLSCSAGRS